MEIKEECKPQDLINGSKENRAILSQDALRQLSKSFTKLIPNNVSSLGKDAFAYGLHKRIRKTANQLQGTFSPHYKISYRPLAPRSLLLIMELPPWTLFVGSLSRLVPLQNIKSNVSRIIRRHGHELSPSSLPNQIITDPSR